MKKLMIGLAAMVMFTAMGAAQEFYWSRSTAQEAGRAVKASPGRIYLITAHWAGTSPVYVQVHNKTSAPADASVPLFSYKCEAGKNFCYSFPFDGFELGTGIYVCFSTTQATKTLAGTTGWFNVLYR